MPPKTSDSNDSLLLSVAFNVILACILFVIVYLLFDAKKGNPNRLMKFFDLRSELEWVKTYQLKEACLEGLENCQANVSRISNDLEACEGSPAVGNPIPPITPDPIASPITPKPIAPQGPSKMEQMQQENKRLQGENTLLRGKIGQLQQSLAKCTGQKIDAHCDNVRDACKPDNLPFKYFHTNDYNLVGFVKQMNMLVTDMRQIFCVVLHSAENSKSQFAEKLDIDFRKVLGIQLQAKEAKQWDESTVVKSYHEILKALSSQPFTFCEELDTAMNGKSFGFSSKFTKLRKQFQSQGVSFGSVLLSTADMSRSFVLDKPDSKYKPELGREQLKNLCRCMSPRIKEFLASAVHAYEYMYNNKINPLRLGFDLMFGCPPSISEIQTPCLAKLNFEYLAYFMQGMQGAHKTQQGTQKTKMSSDFAGAYVNGDHPGFLLLTPEGNAITPHYSINEQEVHGVQTWTGTWLSSTHGVFEIDKRRTPDGAPDIELLRFEAFVETNPHRLRMERPNGSTGTIFLHPYKVPEEGGLVNMKYLHSQSPQEFRRQNTFSQPGSIETLHTGIWFLGAYWVIQTNDVIYGDLSSGRYKGHEGYWLLLLPSGSIVSLHGYKSQQVVYNVRSFDFKWREKNTAQLSNGTIMEFGFGNNGSIMDPSTPRIMIKGIKPVSYWKELVPPVILERIGKHADVLGISSYLKYYTST